jgi:hypothetical protein
MSFEADIISQTDHLAPRMNNHNDIHNNNNNDNSNNPPNRANRPTSPHRPTSLDNAANSFLLCTVIFWPTNVFLELTGELCHSKTSKVVFCALPSLAIFFLWIAMFQTRGCWAISSRGRTGKEYRRMANIRCAVMMSLLLLCVVGLWQATVWLCQDGCGKGVGDGVKCAEDAWAWQSIGKGITS